MAGGREDKVSQKQQALMGPGSGLCARFIKGRAEGRSRGSVSERRGRGGGSGGILGDNGAQVQNVTRMGEEDFSLLWQGLGV